GRRRRGATGRRRVRPDPGRRRCRPGFDGSPAAGGGARGDRAAAVHRRRGRGRRPAAHPHHGPGRQLAAGCQAGRQAHLQAGRMSWDARDRRELEVLHRVALALSHSLAFSDVMDALATELTLAIDRASECTISVWRPYADELEVASVYLMDGGISEPDRGELYQLNDFPASREL